MKKIILYGSRYGSSRRYAEQLSDALMTRIRSNYRFVIGFNAMLIVLGAAGVLTPATSAMLHNLSTLGISVRSMTNLLDHQAKE